MRQTQKNNRARNKGGRKPNTPSVNRVYDSTGPEGKVRGTPQQIIEKYLSLSRDKATAGDRVLAESYLQHAEHYIRILSAAQAAQQQRRDEREEEAESGGDESERESRTGHNGNGAARAEEGDGVAEGMTVLGDDTSAADFASNAGGEGGKRQRRDGEDGEDEGGGQRRRSRRPRRPRQEEGASAADARSGGGEGDSDDDWPGANEVADASNA